MPGPLHSLPVPDARFSSVAIDFVGPLPEENGFNEIITMTDRLGTDIQIIPWKTNGTAEELAQIFFDNWYCKNGLPGDIISDRDKLFVSHFWRAFTKIAGIKHKMSTAWHPETDGASERSNKTVVQALRFYVDQNQKGWSTKLPLV